MVAKKGVPKRIEARNTQNEYTGSNKSRLGIRPEMRRLIALGVTATLIVFLAMILPIYMFEHAMIKYTLSAFLQTVAGDLDGLVTVLTGGGGWFETRFMAVLICAVSGAALGLCGSTYQGAFNNPLAAPKTLGVMAGGAAGALIFLLFFQDVGPKPPGYSAGSYNMAQLNAWKAGLPLLDRLWLEYGYSLCSVAGCLIVVGIVIGLTTIIGHGRMSNIIVIIFGTVFSASVTAIISFSRMYYGSIETSLDMADALREIENYTMNRVFHFQDLLVVVLPIAICMVVVLLMRNRLTLLSFGDDQAASMGINVNRTRYAMIIICTIMTAIAISFAGHVAFLGFISGHLARRIVGPNFKYTLPASMFVGGGLLSLIQWLCQSGLPFTSPYAAGMTCSILGPLLFLVIVLKQRGKEDFGGWR